MIKNYFKTALRNLRSNAFYSVINISGLAVGIATAIMLLLWVENELSFDKFNGNYKHTYLLSSHFKSNGEEKVWPGIPGPVSVMAKSVPGIKSYVRTETEIDQIISNENKTKMLDGNKAMFADSDFFKVFSFPLVQGNRVALFPNPNSVVLTKTLAKNLLNTEDAIGKTIQFYGSNFVVSGVMEDFPQNSSIQADAVFPMSFYAQEFTANGGNGDWKTIDEDLGDYTFRTFVELSDNADAKAVSKALSAAFSKIRESEISFAFQNLADIHLITIEGNTSALRTVRIFSLIVVLLLAIASINYINLSTARSLVRAKEVSIRKMIGASKLSLFFQFFAETALLFFFSLVIAIGLIFLLMPAYNNISGKNLVFNISDGNAWMITLAAIVITLLASGIYPALLLSSFKPIGVLKGKIRSGIGIASFRKILVVFQFAVSVILIVCTLVISRQLNYIQTKDVGYDKSYVFTVPLTPEVTEHVDAVKNDLLKQPGILNTAISGAYNFSDVSGSTGDLDWPGKPVNENLYITQVSVDNNFIPALKIQFLEGKNFTGTPADTGYYIINKTAAQQMGLKPPYVGQEMSLHDMKGTIVGVVQDFNFQSLKQAITPLVFFTRWDKNILYVRTTAQHAKDAVEAAHQQYKKYAGNIPFTYHFLDKDFENQYLAEQRAGWLFNVFAGIAIFISCLGLFGLATYTAQVKIKEIGIRKVLGASVGSIVQLISKEFIVLVVAAIVIAIPVAWWAMSHWLEDFVYRISISGWIFFLAGLAALLIAFVTISFQAIKAAVANPVKSLRTE